MNFSFFFRFPWIQLLSLSPPCCALFTHAVSFSLITCAVVLVAGPIPLFFFKVMFSHLSIWVFFLCNRVQDKGICPYFGSAKKRQSSSQGSCWDPKKPSRMKHQKKKKRKHHPFLCLVRNSTFSVASPALPLLLIHILPHSTFCHFSLAVPFFLKPIWGFCTPENGDWTTGYECVTRREQGDVFFLLSVVI